jgi:hypothetical protein
MMVLSVEVAPRKPDGQSSDGYARRGSEADMSVDASHATGVVRFDTLRLEHTGT